MGRPSAMAGDDVNDSSFTLFMLQASNLVIEKVNYEPSNRPVMDILPSMILTTSFGKSVALSVVTNECVAMDRSLNPENYLCTLNSLNSDRELANDGSYVVPENSTESSTTIRYQINIMTGKISGIYAFMAG